ncbi:hypothetical protein PtA15_15A112 [Puccinia triticina]|uniref:Uncharacterized protein n=1 Tax=Puccinia triticina TaxID=208348 RepID=A0ABY7D5W7_9BASI|nr:uncharacterized protein PtA15_15A112 [Puccinia triticina]WAQ91721.1 hypothetical protein PtA15_15A112 [Puccinia triticina]WAR62520.1 hypothetical protein PtB15_15B105 [Puccinia triticina]
MNNKASSKTGKEKETEVDEIDQALQELSTKLKSIQPADHPQRTLDQQEAAINNLLKVDPKMLDPDLELRRMFGAKVASIVERGDDPPSACSLRRTNHE